MSHGVVRKVAATLPFIHIGQSLEMVLTQSRPSTSVGMNKAVSRLRLALVVISGGALAGCQSLGLSTSVGPSRGAVLKAPVDQQITGMQLIPVTNEVAAKLAMSQPGVGFADALGDAVPIGTIVGVGDVLEVTIWEASPALLFGGGMIDTSVGAPIQATRPGTLPELVVGPSGSITIPFAGQVPAAGRTLRQIEQTIVARLTGKAHQPQVIARVARNTTANVSVVGDVTTAGRVPLTPRGERLLDVIAQAGGTKQPVDRMTVQVTRGDRTAIMPLQLVIQDSRHNIILQRDDVVTALYQPYSFTVLGAAGKNEEVRFEAVGLTLSQALGRVGGLQDMRADPRGVFLFRWESPERIRDLVSPATPLPATQVPVIYRVDLKDPQTYFAAQNFQMRDDDVLYITNSPTADFQRFVNILASSVLPVLSVRNSITTP